LQRPEEESERQNHNKIISLKKLINKKMAQCKFCIVPQHNFFERNINMILFLTLT